MHGAQRLMPFSKVKMKSNHDKGTRTSFVRQSWVDVNLMLLQQNSFRPEAGVLDNVLLTWSLVTHRKW
jgi:hypothetical protein